MAILKMKNIRIAVVKKDLKKSISFLQKAGVVEIKKSKSIEGFKTKDFLSQKLTFERMVASAESALEVLNKIVPVNKGKLSFLNGRKEITMDEYYNNVDESVGTIKFCYDIIALEKQLGECNGEISRINISLDEMKPWMSLDIPTGFKGTRKTKAFIGTFPFETTAGEIITNIAEHGFSGNAEIEVISTDKMQTCIFASCLNEDASALETALRKCGFATVSNPDSYLVPEKKAKELEKRLEGLKKDTEIINELICSFASCREKIEFFIDYYSMRVERYEIYGELLQSENVVIVDGFIPEKYADKVKSEVEEKFYAAVEVTEPNDEEEVPVALSNGPFTKPCQSLVSMYSMPSKTDIDPTSTTAIFFYIFFGMMLSDAGYGLIITIACAIALIKFNLEDNWKNNLKMFLYCGISTIIWGILFGGFFGNLVSAFSTAFMGKEVAIKPLWLDPLDEPLTLLIFGIVLGIIHLFFGMGLKFYNLCRQGKVLDALFDVGLWLLTLVGVILMLVNPVSEMIGIIIPVNMLTAGEYIAIAGAIGLVLTQGRNKKGFGKVISGLASLYDITSYASDILSYSRLMALGLATGVLAMAINTLGTMMTGVFGIILFVIVFLFGSALSLAMNALGAYVHTVRLQYVEYFSKFYEGGGRAFKPFFANTKFFRFKKQ